MNTPCIAGTNVQELSISISNTLQNNAMKAFSIYVLVWFFFRGFNWYMRPIKCSYKLREVTDVLKFLYCLPCFGLSLRKFDEIISSSHQGRAEFVLDIHGSTSADLNVNPTLLYEIPVANLHRATATRFSMVIASRRIVFCSIN